MVQSATQYGLRARALDVKWSKRKVYSQEDLAQPAAQASVAAGEKWCLKTVLCDKTCLNIDYIC